MPPVRPLAVGLIAMISLSACSVTPPDGPTVLAIPGRGQSSEQFGYADARCRHYAVGANGGVTPQQAGTHAGVSSAVTGTAIGAAAGALLGLAGGAAGFGAAFGAGSGLLLGSAAGTGNAERSSDAMQANYNRVYAQCMVAAGQDVALPPGMVAMSSPVPVQQPQAVGQLAPVSLAPAPDGPPP